MTDAPHPGPSPSGSSQGSSPSGSSPSGSWQSGVPQSGSPPAGPAQPARRVSASRSLRLGPLLAVLAVFVAGLVLVAAGDWRTGLYVCGAALLLAALLRLVLPARAVGLLRVRHRAVDVLLLTGGAVAIGALTYLR